MHPMFHEHHDLYHDCSYESFWSPKKILMKREIHERQRICNPTKEYHWRFKENGNTSIDCDILISYLEKVINSSSKNLTQADIEHYKAQLQLWVEAEKRNHSADLEMFRSVIQSGQNALKSSFLLNGGASVALLAFIGKLTEEQASRIPGFAYPLSVFVTGILSIALASGATYLSQWFYAAPEAWKQKQDFLLTYFRLF